MTRRHRWSVVCLWTGVLGMLAVGAADAQQQSSVVQTPPEITIQITPPGRYVCGHRRLRAIRQRARRRAWDILLVLRFVRVRMDSGARLRGCRAVRGLDSRSARRRDAAVGVPGTTVVSMGEGEPTALGGRAEPELAICPRVAVPGSDAAQATLPARGRSARADCVAGGPAGRHHGPIS